MASEAFRKDVSRQLTELQDGHGPSTIEFPSTLSSEERKYIHNLCHQFKLNSKSKGGGANRYLTVSRKAGAAKASGPPLIPGGGLNYAAVSTPAIPSASTPVRLPAGILQDPKLAKLPACPQKWAFSSPADLNRLKGRGKGGANQHGDSSAKYPSREVLDDTEASRIESKPTYRALQAARQKLPAWSYVDEILEALGKSQVVLVAGETGCGKSTQVPQYVLDAIPSARLVVTQPRRIAAVSLAQRVAEERAENVGKAIGYSIHMESKTSSETRCTFCTTGVFRRRLLGDPTLSGLTHIMIDEVHERELHSDFVLVVLKQLLSERPDLQLVLMSATLQLNVFQEFFPDCSTVEIPGRTFPVHRHYLDDVAKMLHAKPRFRPMLGPAFAAAGHVPDEKEFKRQVATNEGHWDGVCGYASYLSGAPLTPARLADGCYKHDVLQQGYGTTFDVPMVDALILHLDEEFVKKQKSNPNLQPGAILIFLPGWGDIDRAKRCLSEHLPASRFRILPCHSQVRPEQQREIFKKPPPGVRKIILATNIAETSITIEDVSVVIDTGRAKETSYDPYLKVGTLATVFISKASSAQRAGRAGRTKEGTCYHLFSKSRLAEMEEFRAPELLRSPLEDVCLHTAHLLAQRKALNKSAHSKGSGASEIATWLAQAPQPPEAVAVRNAIELLKVLGALTPTGGISGLGVQLANLPLPATVARSVVWGVLFGCLDSVLVILCASTGRDPFQLPKDSGKGGGKMGNRGSSFNYLSGLLKKFKRELAGPFESDHIALLGAVEYFEQEKSSGGESAAHRACDRYSLNKNVMQSIVEVRDKMKRELKQQRLLTDELLDFANRNAGDYSVLLAVVVAGVYPNLAAKHSQKKKIEVNRGRVEAGMHPSSIINVGGGGKSTQWLCYAEMTQVEQRYSMTGVSWASPVSLLLLCGDDPVEVQGDGADVSASLMDGWVEFAMPKNQVLVLQKLRYRLRQAFSLYCRSPQKACNDFTDVLDSAVDLIQKSMNDSGQPVAFDTNYKPKILAYVGKQNASSAAADYSVLDKSTKISPIGALATGVTREPSKVVLKDGLEIACVTDLIREIYGPPPQGKRPIEWHIAREDGSFVATLTIPQDGSSYIGPLEQNQKLAQRMSAKSAFEALQSSQANMEEDAAEETCEAGHEEECEVEDEVHDELDDIQEDGIEEACEDGYEGACEEEDINDEIVDDAVVEDDEVVVEDVETAEEVEEVCEEVEEVGNDAAEVDNELEYQEDEDIDLLGDVDPSMQAALRFMQGDTDYKDSILDMDEDSPASKRQRFE